MRKYLDLLVVPQGKQPALNLRVSTLLVKVAAVSVGVWLIGLLVLTVFYASISHKALIAEQLRQENERLRDYNAKVVEIEKSFKKNLELVAKIAELAGIELGDPSPQQVTLEDSLDQERIGRQGPSDRPVLAGLAGEQPALSAESLDSLRVPHGRPLYGWTSRGYAVTDSASRHEGVDIAVKEGTPVVATATGIVIFAGWDQVFGNLMVIDHENGYRTVYGHNQKIMANQGEKVYKGDIIALSGNTGQSSAPHLHYGVLQDGVAVDPSPYLD